MKVKQSIPKELLYTVKHFNTEFPNDSACLDYIKEQRYPGGVTQCAKCGTGEFVERMARSGRHRQWHLARREWRASRRRERAGRGVDLEDRDVVRAAVRHIDEFP